MELEQVNCYYCQSWQYTYYDQENGYQLVKCRNCGLLYVNPRPKESTINRAAHTGLHQGDKIFNATNKLHRSRINRYVKILATIYPEIPNQKIKWLDIGCGNGEFLMALKTHFGNHIEVHGIEPNEHKLKTTTSLGLDVDFSKYSDHIGEFDAISMLNVYSHIANPIEFIKNWQKTLKPAGELIIQTGDSANVEPLWHQKPYNLPDHLSFANKEILEGIMQKTGFQIQKCKSYQKSNSTKTKLIAFSKDLAKLVLHKNNNLRFYNKQPGKFFPEYHHASIWVKAKRIKESAT